MQIVYHGGYCKIEEPKIIDGKFTKDFGNGFYCTILEEQAIKWAKKYLSQYFLFVTLVGFLNLAMIDVSATNLINQLRRNIN